MIIIAIMNGLLYGASIFLMLRRSFFRLILGVILFGYATIYFLFTITGTTKESPPLLNGALNQNLEKMADPLPQALALTAIVISIGVQFFTIILLKKVVEEVGTDDLDDLRTTDKIDV